jgi:lipopolysaccharide export system permease protein
MKILSRYIIKEHLPPFLFALAVLMFIFLMQFMLKYITKIFGKGLSIFTIIELVFFNLAWMFALAVPMAVLIATLMSFGRLSGDNEITILKSSGISIYRIIRPAIFFGVVITILMVIFNDKVLPDFNHRARVMFNNIGQKKATLKLEPGIFFTVGKFSFHAEKIDKTLGEELLESVNLTGPEFDTSVKPDKLINVTIFDRSNPTKTITVTAHEGYMLYSKPKKSLLFTLFDGEYHELDNINTEEYRFSHFVRNDRYIPAPEFELEMREDSYRGDREMNIKMMMERVTQSRESLENERKKIKGYLKELEIIIPSDNPDTFNNRDSVHVSFQPIEWQRAADKAHRNASRLFQKVRISDNKISSDKRNINKFLVEVHKKFSIPFASIVFILIGAPLGIAARRGSLGVGATLSIIFFLIYWACLILGEDLADRQLLTPFWGMWFPNVIIGLVGFYITWRTVKESTFINWDKLGSYLKKFIKLNNNNENFR